MNNTIIGSYEDKNVVRCSNEIDKKSKKTTLALGLFFYALNLFVLNKIVYTID